MHVMIKGYAEDLFRQTIKGNKSTENKKRTSNGYLLKVFASNS